MARNKILVISDEFDPHVDRMMAMLHDLRVECLRLVPSRFPADSTIRLAIDSGSCAGEVGSPSRTIDMSTVRSVWVRHPGPHRLPDSLSIAERRFAFAEARSAFRALYRTASCFWVNHPDHEDVADSKPLQLKVASEIGFRIPNTLVTNDASSVRAFMEANRSDVVYKPLNSGFVLSDESVCYTRRLTEDDGQVLDLIRNTPGIFQEHVHKQLDIRVTVIGTDVFAAEIHSQSAPDGSIDWRAAHIPDLEHRAHALPQAVADRCRALLRRFGLAYGAIDLILTPDGQYVFLEVNPSGQFGWIEARTGQPLTATLARLLIAGGQPASEHRVASRALSAAQ